MARDGFPGHKAVSSGGGFASVTSKFGRSWHRPVHRYRRGWHPTVPLYLDRRHSSPVVVQVRQTVAPVTVIPATFAIPSVADLPVSTGIREARPSAAAVYVLNDAVQPRRESFEMRERSPGPRIITLADREEGWSSDAPTPIGARIIHLRVPVGARY
jgi:hypothetical protein